MRLNKLLSHQEIIKRKYNAIKTIEKELLKLLHDSLDTGKQPSEIFYKKCVHKNFAKLKKDSGTSVFPVTFEKFLRTPCLQSTSGQMLMDIARIINEWKEWNLEFNVAPK